MSETAYRFESCRGHFSRALLAQGGVGTATVLSAAYECTRHSERLALLPLHQNRSAKSMDILGHWHWDSGAVPLEKFRCGFAPVAQLD